MSAYITADQIARLRSTDELNVDPARRSSMAIGAQVWDESFSYKGAKGGWLSRTVARNVRPADVPGALAELAANPGLRDLHAYVEGF